MKGFAPENPVVVGGYSSELQPDGSEKPLSEYILRSQWKDAEPDVFALLEAPRKKQVYFLMFLLVILPMLFFQSSAQRESSRL
jgi:hypothetical protein